MLLALAVALVAGIARAAAAGHGTGGSEEAVEMPAQTAPERPAIPELPFIEPEAETAPREPAEPPRETVAATGDLNADGEVDAEDVKLLESAYNAVRGDPKYNPAADMNGDGKIDFNDLPLLSNKITRPLGPKAPE